MTYLAYRVQSLDRRSARVSCGLHECCCSYLNCTNFHMCYARNSPGSRECVFAIFLVSHIDNFRFFNQTKWSSVSDPSAVAECCRRRRRRRRATVSRSGRRNGVRGREYETLTASIILFWKSLRERILCSLVIPNGFRFDIQGDFFEYAHL